MVINQLTQARGQARERQFMAWQNEVIVGCKCLKVFARIEPTLDRVGIGFGRVHAKVR